jgi:hypothetical protein
MKVGTLLGKAIYVGSFKIRMSMTSKVSPSPIIRENENYIRTILGRNHETRKQES